MSAAAGADKTYDVVIVGAGIAGIAAAVTATKAGLSVIVLEGRDRVGGRLWTTELGDFGASWIHGHSGNPIYNIAKEEGMELKKTNYENSLLYTAKGEADESLEERIEDVWGDIEEKLEKKARRLRGAASSSTTLHDLVKECIAEKKLSERDTSLAWFGAATEVEHEFGADCAWLSATDFDEGEELKGEDFVFPKGYAQIIDALMKKEKFEVVCGQSVAKITYGTEAGVTVDTRKGDVYRGKRCIVTVPLGVLQKSLEKAGAGTDAAVIDFQPALPEKTVAAIGKLGMGTLNKYVMQFPEAAWPKKYDLFQYLDKAPPFVFPEMLNFSKYAPEKKTIIAFSAGTEAIKLSALPDEAVQEQLYAQMKLMWPGLAKPIQFGRTCWDKDPFSCGAYSFLAPGGTARDRAEFEHPIGDEKEAGIGALWFAGEHTYSAFPSTVQGAYLSGVRAATSVVAKHTGLAPVAGGAGVRRR